MIKCLLWDFGDTLCDELSLWRGSAEWMEVYHSFGADGGLGAAWSLGEVATDEVLRELAARMSLATGEIRRHFLRAELFEFFPTTYRFFRDRHRPQAVVTVNPGLFREIAGVLGIEEFVETVVISGEEGTVDKGKLCSIALDRMGGRFRNEEALLIDNSLPNLAAWAERSGVGYLYTGDAAFGRDSVGGPDGLAAAGLGSSTADSS